VASGSLAPAGSRCLDGHGHRRSDAHCLCHHCGRASDRIGPDGGGRRVPGLAHAPAVGLAGGIAPDIRVPLTFDTVRAQFKDGRDVVLQAAIRALP
jgi:hypothetical protein